MTYNEEPEGYVVEGDLLVYSEDLNNPTILGKQARSINVVKCDIARNILVKNSLPNGIYKRALPEASKQLNSIGGSFIKFSITNRNQHINVKAGNINNRLRSIVPTRFRVSTNGLPLKEILINVKYKYPQALVGFGLPKRLVGTTGSFKDIVALLIHEIAHTVGMEHNEVVFEGVTVNGAPVVGGAKEFLVKGTQEFPNKSMFYTGEFPGSDAYTNQLTSGDKKFFQVLYGGGNPQCKTRRSL